ncbi:hypothetical protein IGW14_10710 [Streptomyces hygroscopicus subsp. hygroscopicus]|uniref:hypothetical protein n=1 Tax=Streptomyces hygroscopicus TaxID=1912 RepID=UPI001C65847C|nr:hypothetical protein [Streptomyces hygroscopicus]MBW8088492.1 hypothetical protein [Streptomyces hygroscopicus subsp. hygroscopicus]
MTSPMPWFETLTDSVYALGAAAREAQRAARTAELARDAYDLDRLRPVDGEVRLDGRAPGGVPFRPHDAALFTIGDVLMDQAHKLRTLYSQAAEGYAYGTAWAILRVLEGQQPDAVQLGRSREGFYVIPGELSPLPPLMPGLERWNGYNKLVHAHARWAICEEAGLFAEYLDEQPQLSDHEAGELHEAIDTATGVPDAAYAYGQLAESALRFALLEPRAQHARQQSAR